MELRLRALVEVVRQAPQAAKAVFTTPAHREQAVRQLEDELGMPLLDRHAQPPRLTAAGEIVYRRAVAMLAQRDDLYAELDELKGLKRGVLRLGLPPLGSSTLFAPMFARFRSRYPQVEISLVEHGSRRLEEMVMAGEIELAASLKPVPDHFEWQPVAREPLVALMPADHPKARAEAVSLRELRDSPFILFETGFALNRILHDACERARLRARDRGAQRPGRFHPWRWWPPAWGRLSAAPEGARVHACRRLARAAARRGHGLGNGAGLAPRRLPVARRPGLAGLDARSPSRSMLMPEPHRLARVTSFMPALPATPSAVCSPPPCSWAPA